MTMDLESQRIINPILTDRALGYSSEMQIWDMLAPRVEVPFRAGRIVKFDKTRWQQYNTKRAPGANTEAIDISYSADPFYLVQDRVKTIVPYESQEEARLPGIDLRAESVDAAREIQERSVEFDAAKLLTDYTKYPSANAPTIASGDRWNNYTTSVPIAQIRNAASVIRRSIGRDPNTLMISPDAWNQGLAEHPNLLTKIQYTQTGYLTPEILGQIIGLKVIIGNDITQNAAGVVSDIWGVNGACAILAYVASPQAAGARATMRQPSFAYTYVHTGSPMVEEGYYDKDTASWRDYLTYERETYITLPEAGYLFRNVLG